MALQRTDFRRRQRVGKLLTAFLRRKRFGFLFNGAIPFGAGSMLLSASESS